MLILEDYIDPDVAYVLGLIVGRGTLSEIPDKRIIIKFPYKALVAEGVKTSYNQKHYIEHSLYIIVERLREVLGCDIHVERQEREAKIVARFLRNTIAWRDIRYLLGNAWSFFDARIPNQIFSAPHDIQKEFVRGIADCAGFIRHSNNYMGGKRRVYLEIANQNWILPIQLCNLLQTHLDIPVQLIQWGHPNTREPYQTSHRTTWAREHQIKIFSEAFEPIGFYVEYKNRILKEFIEEDKHIHQKIVKCNPDPRIRRSRKKPHHPDENSELLPEKIRGMHFDNYWSICKALGCKQGWKAPGREPFPEPEEG